MCQPQVHNDKGDLLSISKDLTVLWQRQAGTQGHYSMASQVPCIVEEMINFNLFMLDV